VRKKNKRKAPEFKKPFIVLTRSKIAGWLLLIFFLCAWMFVLGILVGRGTAPLKFDLAALDKEKAAPKNAESPKKEKTSQQQNKTAIKDKTKLDFYEALKEDKEDTKVTARTEQKATKNKAEKPAAKFSEPAKNVRKSKSSEGQQKKKPTEKKSGAIDKTKPTDPIYTIQAAAVRNGKDADRLIEKLKKRGYPAYRSMAKVPGKGVWYRVRIGSYKSKSAARPTLDKLKKEGRKPILVQRKD
jgi:cell division septation protein DedD